MAARILSALLLAVFAVHVASTASHNLPPFFIPNQGQASWNVRFMAKGSGLTAHFLFHEVAFDASGALVRMHFEGAAPDTRIEGARRLPGQVNFLTGSPNQWRTGLPIYGAVAYRGLYPGIDMTYGINGRSLKSEFAVAPGADPGQIRFRYEGVSAVGVDADGSLSVATASGTIRELSPVAYQARDGSLTPVEAHFELEPNGTIRFMLGGYDPSCLLIIDPLVSYSTLLGGSSASVANAIAVDSTGAAYIAGVTESFDFPTVNPEQAALGGGNDAFVAKLNASGSALIYCTYLGGRNDDRALGIAIDSTGAAYVTGSTQSPNFPVRNAFQANLAGAKNAFVAKLTPTGNNLAYSSFLGGNGSDVGNGIAVDAGGNGYITGDTTSTTFPVNSFEKTYHGGQDAFVAKVNAAGSALTYCTYLGGGSIDHGAAIAVDSTGAAFVTGGTSSTDFPVVNAMQAIIGGGRNAFVARLKADGSGLLFSTFLGGSGGSTEYLEEGQAIATDSAGNAYIAGVTASTNFPILGPEQSTLDGWTDAFVTKVGSMGALIYSTYLGGSGNDYACAIAVDSNGYAYIGGYTYSQDFPLVSASQPAGPAGIALAFVAKLVPAGNSLAFATYLGGNDSTSTNGIAIDPSGNIYVTGSTFSSNFPTTPNAYRTQNVSDYGAYVTKYVFNLAPSNVSVTPNSGGGVSQTFSFQYSDGNGASDFSVVSAMFNSSTNLNGACAVIYNRAMNSLALLTDAGAQPATTIPPGNGTVQNGQCILNGGASSVSLSGNILTLNLVLSFQPGFGGAKNIYMQAANPYQTTAWQIEGRWTTSAPAIPSLISFSPASGSGISQAFTVAYSSPQGGSDILSVQVVIGPSLAPARNCYLGYDHVNNHFLLLNDSGTSWLSTVISPGAGTLANSQCSILGSGSSATVSGSQLIVVYSVQFQTSFAGAKTIWTNAYSVSSGMGSPWKSSFNSTNLTYTVIATPIVPSLVSFSPASGTGSSQVFTAEYSSPAGGQDILSTQVVIGSGLSSVQSCYFGYNSVSNQFLLLNDAGNAWLPGLPPGAGSVANSQCVVLGSESGATVSGNQLTVTYNIQFKTGYAGAKSIWTNAYSISSGLGSAWQSNLNGKNLTYTVATALATPTLVSFSPLAAAGMSQAFTEAFSSAAGGGDIMSTQVLIGASFSSVQSCYLGFDAIGKQFLLLNDAGNAWLSGVAPGGGSIGNSQCTVLGSGSSVALSGNQLTLTYNVQFQPGFSGMKAIWTNAYSLSSGLGSTFQSSLNGTNLTYTVSSSSIASLSSGPVVPALVSFGPTSGVGRVQTFTGTYRSTAGGRDILSTQVLINTSLSSARACYFSYDNTSNRFLLLNDAGNTWLTNTVAPGSGSVSNSQCTLLGGGSNATISGSDLVVNYSVQFNDGFAGPKTIWTNAYSVSSGLGSPWASAIDSANLSWTVN